MGTLPRFYSDDPRAYGNRVANAVNTALKDWRRYYNDRKELRSDPDSGFKLLSLALTQEHSARNFLADFGYDATDVFHIRRIPQAEHPEPDKKQRIYLVWARYALLLWQPMARMGVYFVESEQVRAHMLQAEGKEYDSINVVNVDADPSKFSWRDLPWDPSYEAISEELFDLLLQVMEEMHAYSADLATKAARGSEEADRGGLLLAAIVGSKMSFSKNPENKVAAARRSAFGDPAMPERRSDYEKERQWFLELMSRIYIAAQELQNREGIAGLVRRFDRHLYSDVKDYKNKNRPRKWDPRYTPGGLPPDSVLQAAIITKLDAYDQPTNKRTVDSTGLYYEHGALDRELEEVEVLADLAAQTHELQWIIREANLSAQETEVLQTVSLDIKNLIGGGGEIKAQEVSNIIGIPPKQVSQVWLRIKQKVEAVKP